MLAAHTTTPDAEAKSHTQVETNAFEQARRNFYDDYFGPEDE